MGSFVVVVVAFWGSNPDCRHDFIQDFGLGSCVGVAAIYLSVQICITKWKSHFSPCFPSINAIII